jgi:hypothetical protein
VQRRRPRRKPPRTSLPRIPPAPARKPLQAVPAKTTRKNQKAHSLSSAAWLEIQKLSVPIQPPQEVPNINPKPTNRNTIALMQKSMKFFMMMLMLFFARANPSSTMANPACITNTSAPVITIHTRFKLSWTVSMSAFTAASAGAAGALAAGVEGASFFTAFATSLSVPC